MNMQVRILGKAIREIEEVLERLPLEKGYGRIDEVEIQGGGRSFGQIVRVVGCKGLGGITEGVTVAGLFAGMHDGAAGGRAMTAGVDIAVRQVF